ncbi:DUF192 domain-containing protein [Hoeflea sp. YIM 152468]|uniref:DUF192 domain-containing protein n=1 Tax=Hoeflea sp. YIM 152468 TaxID=3031759 RepID=UPI0023D9AD57|nr:DUF192 domain-containing protein [Hoeflea sp. YIM 152468]MDF1609923.1 DUF192 domain-containing protein [Hoeflea sp. YIM 152468]
MRKLMAAAALVLAGLATGFTAQAAATPLPVDSERLVIQTAAGPVRIAVELALTPETRARGLMNRESMAPDHGMLFKFDQTRPVMMWMKNTPLPLDMLFLDEGGTIVGIVKDTIPYSETIISSPSPVRYVLELNAGTADRRGIAPGDKAHHRVIGQ